MVEKHSRTGLRRYRTRSEAQELVAEYQASGLTLREFCRQKDLAPNSVARYLKRYGRQAVPADGSQQWVAVEVAERREASGDLIVVLRGGRRIEVAGGFEPATLERLVMTLERIG